MLSSAPLLRVFIVNHNNSSTTEAYWISNIENQEEELLRGSEATVVEGKWVACLGTRGSPLQRICKYDYLYNLILL